MLKFLENVHPTLCVTCHVSPVMCHLSRVTCHLSHVNIFFFFFFFTQKKLENYPLKKIGQNGGASRWRVCYQRGLPRLFLGWMPAKGLRDSQMYVRQSSRSIVGASQMAGTQLNGGGMAKETCLRQNIATFFSPKKSLVLAATLA